MRRQTRAVPCTIVAAITAALALVSIRPPTVSAEESPSSDRPAQLGELPVFSAGGLEYRPGRGLRLGTTGFTIGGFTNVKVEDTEQSGGAFALDNLNFFLIFDRFTRFRAVAELQLKDIYVAEEGNSGTQDFAFDVRRLFGDFVLIDELHLRAGTFLTPVGYWNLILAPPLTWTTEPPLIVEETFFQQTTTGVMLHGSTPVAEGQLGYSLFSQFLQPLADDPDLNPPDYTAGARLTYELAPAWSVGTTYQGADTNGEWSQLGAFHLLWQPARGEILSELYFQEGTDPSFSQWGMYAQGVFEVVEPFYAVGRYEHYDPPSPDKPVNLFTFGGVWKPFPFMAIKVEYRISDRPLGDEDLDGFFASFTTFF
jgi:hypothetical protein